MGYTYGLYANLPGISVNQCSAPMLSLGVSSSTNQITNPGFRYDAAGELLSDGADTYVWNATGLMSSAAGYSYAYDGDNRRVEKSIGGHGRGDEDRNPDPTVHNANGKLYWYGLSGEVLAESDLSGNITSEYIYFGGRRIARRDPGTGNVYYFLGDRLGSARVMTDASGNIVHESDFYPYGGERVITNTVDDSHKFTGDERDSETGLDHTLNRQYSSNTGHWLSPDSVKGKAGSPQSWNRYAYTKGNPISRTDPNGSCDTEVPCGDGSPGDIIATSIENGTVLDGDFIDQLFTDYNCGSVQNTFLGGGSGGCIHQVTLIAYSAPPPAPPPPPPPNCEAIETDVVFLFLNHYDSPLAAYASTIVKDSDKYSVDDRFIVALADAESSYGNNLNENYAGKNNYWSYGVSNGPHPYSSPLDAINDVTNLFQNDPNGNYFAAGRTTTDSIYKEYEGTDSYQTGLTNVNKVYDAFGRSPMAIPGNPIPSDPHAVKFSRCPAGL